MLPCPTSPVPPSLPRSVFTGEISVANDPSGYLDGARQLVTAYRELSEADPAPLLVNTMGWAKGERSAVGLRATGDGVGAEVRLGDQSGGDAVREGAGREEGAARGWVLCLCTSWLT